MSIFFVFIVVIYLIICPFYFFESGNPQLADFLLFLGIIPLITTKHSLSVYNKHKVVRYLFWFFIFSSIINICYWAYYTLIGVENSMYKFIFFYSFNFLFFLLIVSFIKSKVLIYQFKIFYFSIFASTLLQFFLAILGIGGNQNNLRPSIFFNNPNQLAYFALLMISVMTIFYIRYNFNKLVYYITFLCSTYLVLYSGSRGALSIILLILPIVFFKRIDKKDIIIFFGLIILTPVILNTNFIKEKINLIMIRNATSLLKNSSEIENRGYDRVYSYPKYLIYGAGEGKYERFDDNEIPLEIHSGFVTILFSYGILGFLIFIRFFYNIIKDNFKINIFILMPVILYNLTHNGFRAPLFWGLLAFIYLTSIHVNKNEFIR